MLNDASLAYQLPLAVIAHIDLNAFFAQCEQMRLGKLISDPVVCCQWLSLIAISYAARKYGIGRMDTLKSAQEKCPGLIVGHAAVFKKGESHWQYLDKKPDQGIHKVSLDPYRRELRKIIKILKRECDLVEKASVDECYLDFGRLVYSRLLALFPELQNLQPDDTLPSVPAELPADLHWIGEIMPTFTEEKEQLEAKALNSVVNDTETPNPPVCDWDDVCMLIGSQIMYTIRGEVFRELKYTTSGGLARSKPTAKLAGGFIKPDMQTIIRNRLTYQFLKNFELVDFTLMGGKAGEVAMEKLQVPSDTNSIAYIRENWELQDMKKEFPNEELLAEKIYELVRGTNQLRLKLRTDVKSMMSRKNFLSRYPVKTLGDAFDWIKVYLGDLYGRLIELDDENMNLSMLQKSDGEKTFIYRPRTVSLQITSASYTKHSKQTQFPVIQNLDKFKTSLETAGFRLLCELLETTNAVEMNPTIKFRELRVTDSRLREIKIPTMANMSLVISNFVKTSDASLIDSYGRANSTDVSTQEAIKRLFDEVNKPVETVEEPKPKKVTRSSSYIKKMFADFEAENAAENASDTEVKSEKGKFKEDKDYVKKMFDEYQTNAQVMKAASESPKRSTKSDAGNNYKSASRVSQLPKPEEDILLKELIRNQFCSQCNIAVDDVFEHKDYHIALELSLKLNGTEQSEVKSPKTQEKKEKVKKRKKLAKGQTQLPFWAYINGLGNWYLE